VSYHVRLLKMGEAEVPGPEVFWMSRWQEWETLFFYMAVILGNDTTAIINTGPPPDLTVLNRAWRAFAGERCQMKRSEEERPEAALAKIGIKPDDVNYVLLTPIQAYTTSNIPLFQNATICLSRRGWTEDVVAPLKHAHVPRELFIRDPVLHHLLFEAWDRVRLLDEEDEIRPGMRAWWAGTHHRSSMVYAIETGRGTVMIGDCAFKYGNLDGPPLGIAESLAEADRAYHRIRAEADHFIPLYDPDVLSRYPHGEVA
jgi:hypothetical protein